MKRLAGKYIGPTDQEIQKMNFNQLTENEAYQVYALKKAALTKNYGVSVYAD